MIEYGITTSKAHAWCHVVPGDGCFYLYPTSMMREAIARGSYQRKEIASAIGLLVPITEVFIRQIFCPSVIDSFDWAGRRSDAQLGRQAEEVFAVAARLGWIPILPTVERFESREEQFAGKDYKLTTPANLAWEIKLDTRAGWHKGGSGNLFVQTHEGGHAIHGRNAHRLVGVGP